MDVADRPEATGARSSAPSPRSPCSCRRLGWSLVGAGAAAAHRRRARRDHRGVRRRVHHRPAHHARSTTARCRCSTRPSSAVRSGRRSRRSCTLIDPAANPVARRRRHDHHAPGRGDHLRRGARHALRVLPHRHRPADRGAAHHRRPRRPGSPGRPLLLAGSACDLRIDSNMRRRWATCRCCWSAAVVDRRAASALAVQVPWRAFWVVCLLGAVAEFFYLAGIQRRLRSGLVVGRRRGRRRTARRGRCAASCARRRS